MSESFDALDFPRHRLHLPLKQLTPVSSIQTKGFEKPSGAYTSIPHEIAFESLGNGLYPEFGNDRKHYEAIAFSRIVRNPDAVGHPCRSGLCLSGPNASPPKFHAFAIGTGELGSCSCSADAGST
jgi:hypothetical protein